MSEVTILYWQASSILNPYLSSGTKDIDASSIVLEPLANISPAGTMVPVLAAEIPTLDNGGVSEDLTSITWTLKDGVLWSDGSPVTAEDVIFTWEYCTHPDAGCTYDDSFDGVVSVEDAGMNQVKITFDAPKPYPYLPFVTQTTPIIQKAQFGDCLGANMSACSDANFGPIGTGPFMVEDFRPNDVVTYVRNPNFRDADMGKPAFDRVVFKGGGDAESAARAVLETGEADYAWNLQVSPAVLNAMEAAGNGTVIVAYGQAMERILINFTDPSPDNPNRSVWMPDGANAHPFLSNKTIRQAMSMAIDRNISASVFFGGDPASPDTFQKFYSDVQMYTSGSSSTDMEGQMQNYRCGEWPSPDNNWLGSNILRWCNEEYDAVFEEYVSTGGVEARAEYVIRLNDIMIQDYAQLPLVYRSSAASAVSNSLGGVEINGWDSEMWNIEDWYRADM
ncbi:MAG: peptide ABC transporter substrate-binding protein [Chloroflexi bacterium]|nr:peptide ABC transporter substrate-binding protein [Chloroflexota bacterium]